MEFSSVSCRHLESTLSCRVNGSAARPWLKIFFQGLDLVKPQMWFFIKDTPLLIFKPPVLSETFKPQVLDSFTWHSPKVVFLKMGLMSEKPL